MRNKFWMIMLVLVLSALAACSSAEEKKVEELEMPQALEVQLEVPEAVDVNANVKMNAIVTQGDENVADANDVDFEVWEEGKKEESIMIKAKNNNDGTYEAETTFDHDGVFTVQVHVTARDMHTMPKKLVTVGKGATQEDNEQESNETTQGFNMNFMKPDSVDVGNETILTVQLQNDNVPLEKAQVTYEIWNSSISENREWIDAEEFSPGEYTAKHIFKDGGTYSVQIHVKNDEGLHEHEEYQVEVKN